jgi:signal transduction histidine kinase
VDHNEVKYKAHVVREFVQGPDVECHASQINQAIMNLLNHAAQAIGPERGHSQVRTTAGQGSAFRVGVRIAQLVPTAAELRAEP